MEFPPQTEFSAEARENLSSDLAFETARELRNELDEKAGETTPKRGAPTKDAQRAQRQKEMIAAVSPVLSMANEAAADRWPELRYTDEQIEILSILSGAVLAKHYSFSHAEYEEEIALAIFVASTGVAKGSALYRRLKREAAEADAEISDAERADPNNPPA